MYKEGEPCTHKGCLNHISHPCEGCGRIAGRNNMFNINYEIKGDPEDPEVFILRDDKVMDTFDIITDLKMIPKLLRSMAVVQGKLKLTPELQREREDILAWLIVHHN